VLPSAKFPGLLCRSPLKIPGKIGVGNDADPPPNGDAMTNFHLSDRVLAILRLHGWHEGRQIDIGDITDLLRSNSIEASPIAATFLREFHGLHLQFPNGGLSSVKFDVYEEMTFLEKGELGQLESLVKQPLCPVGLGGRFLLHMTSGEKIFLHDEWLLYLRARNVLDAFEVICTPEFKDYQTIMLADDQKPPAFRDAGY
jgi:hypothetical protein